MKNKLLLKIGSSIKDALKIIDSNGLGLALVSDDSKYIYGTISDGDIRRYLLKGGQISDNINKCYNESFVKANSKHDRESLLKKLDRGISAIPVINSEGKLLEVITREHFPIYNNNSFYVRSKSPARISFGGGGSDLTYYFNDNRAAVINSAINLFAHAILIPKSDEKIEIFSSDFNKKKIFVA